MGSLGPTASIAAFLAVAAGAAMCGFLAASVRKNTPRVRSAFVLGLLARIYHVRAPASEDPCRERRQGARATAEFSPARGLLRNRVIASEDARCHTGSTGLRAHSPATKAAMVCSAAGLI